MPKRQFVQEAASLPRVKSADGTYRVVAITEGEGSSGVYSAELIDKSAHVFEGVPSFLNHPIDPAKPHLRPVESIAGRFSNMVVEDGPHGRQIAGDFKPRKEYAEFIEEFQDIVGLSIYCSATGEELDDGRIAVEAFDEQDPYRSVDIVVAAGRGGRFKRAEESLRAIESSLGIPQGNKPAAESSVEEKKENHMDEKDIKAIAVATATAVAESLKNVIDFVTAESAKRDESAKSEATAEDLDAARAEGAKAASESFAAIDAAELPEKIAEGLKAKVLEGKDVTDAIADAKAVAEAVAESAQDDAANGYIIESAGSGSTKRKDWSY